jgi:transcriptional accessory protein Tex/SPT6
LSLHDLQKDVGQELLTAALESVAVARTAHVGVDLTLLVEHPHLAAPLAFVPGFGPARAYYLTYSILNNSEESLDMRKDLMTSFGTVFTRSVFENSIGYIRVSGRGFTEEPLDNTRIHQMHYSTAVRLACEALGLRPDDETSIETIMDETNIGALKRLDLKSMAEELLGDPTADTLLQFICDELRSPFYVDYSNFHEIDSMDALYKCVGETYNTLRKGVIVDAVVTNKGDSNVSCRLECGLVARLETHDLREVDMNELYKGM